MITKRVFGKTEDGREVLAFTLHDKESSVTVLNLGGIVQSIVVPDKDGNLRDVALGHNTVEGYEKNRGYLGAIVGRFANRIEKGRLFLGGELHQLWCDPARGYHIHGGQEGFNKKIFSYGIAGDALALSYISPDGEEGYPGALKLTVVYTFYNRTLKIHYRATTDKTTAVNLTNHSYFNLNGEASGDVLGHTLWLDSDEIVPTDEGLVPHGGFRRVEGTPFDFNEAKPIGRDIEADDTDLRQGKGYDHCFMLKNGGTLTKFAEAQSPASGIKMSAYTNLPAVQLYTGNALRQDGKSTYYGPRTGFCLETQMIPNNVNVAEYREKGSSVLAPGEVYDFTTAYEFKA